MKKICFNKGKLGFASHPTLDEIFAMTTPVEPGKLC